MDESFKKSEVEPCVLALSLISLMKTEFNIIKEIISSYTSFN